MLEQQFFSADIILGIATQYLGYKSSVHILWWVIVLKYLDSFWYFFTFVLCLQISAVDFSNSSILAVSGVLQSRLAGLVYHVLWPSYYLLPGRRFEGLFIQKFMFRFAN
jgi:hypothetical protein